ncbi:MAG: hypothetical protein HYV07_20095 [Deltaproteobacteria bacterium]|nr:hypothetical protein [Deltaproteobacteria bacterium]
MRASFVAGLVAGASVPAGAFASPGELILTAEAGAASMDSGEHVGLGAEAALAYGAVEAVSFFVFGGGHVVIDADPILTFGGGVQLALDVLRTVPFFEATFHANARSGELSPGVRIGLGADYFLTPEVSIGLAVRYAPWSDFDELISGRARLSFHLEL